MGAYVIQALAGEFEERYKDRNRWTDPTPEEIERLKRHWPELAEEMTQVSFLGTFDPDGPKGWVRSSGKDSYFYRLLEVMFDAAGRPTGDLSSKIRRALGRP